MKHKTNSGPSTVLTVKKEGVLVAYLLYMADHGFPLTVNMAKRFAWAVVLSSGTSERFNEEIRPGKPLW